MTKDKMLSYINDRIAACEEMVDFAKSNKVDISLLDFNAEMLDFYKSVLPIVENASNQ